MTDPEGDWWASGQAYEPYVGRWSRLVAESFISRLEPPVGASWLDVGCGTGALTGAVLAGAQPGSVVGIDPSEAFVSFARARITDPRVRFRVGDAQRISDDEGTYDRVVSGLVLNFVPDPAAAVAEMRRVTRAGGWVAAYVWDYVEGMEMMRRFWDAAVELDPAAEAFDEGARFTICRPGPLGKLWDSASLRDVSVDAIEIDTVFQSFDDYWRPFLGGRAPAPAYNMSLEPSRRGALESLLRSRLPARDDGTIALRARAWAISGRV